MRTPTVLDIGTCEFETTPLTTGELVAIHVYEAAVAGSGIRDCFDSFTVESARDHETEFGQGATRVMLREYARYLHTWYLALDALLGDGLTCTAQATRYSTAMTRYITAAADDYHGTRQDFEHTVTTWTLALLASGPDADYPPPTRTLNLPMQTLSDE
ncbi:hypothetical protein [Actinacidiphila acididurans]|uniref:Uncharacterized protein n=1 Tax=Actinacidiphila acididurans TaxID=2784346 RepID=A0ABS2TXA9_9ACTN|nr:hypothetical protein [Actinacidiphila acididurans]MBM9507981.1 hypothetical protein [Actinacidiphila acididurans]